MINAATALSAAAPAFLQTPEPQTPSAQTTSSPQDQAASKSNVRLFIEQDPNTHTYVYRLVDSSTGKVLVEIPREQLSTLAASSPAVGALIGTTA